MGLWSDCKSSKTKELKLSIETGELLGLRAVIHPEGDDANLTFYTTGGEIKLAAHIEHLSTVQTEIRAAAILMQYRQTKKSDEGEAALNDMLHAALRPAAVSVLVDSKTGDRQFVLQFSDRLPIVIQLSPDQLNAVLANISVESRRTAN